MASRLFVFLSLFGTIASTHPYYVGEVERAGACTYNFQVWTPDDNLMQQLQNLESKIVNASLYSENRYLKLQNDILALTNYNQNISGFIERQAKECRPEDRQLESAFKNLSLELENEIANLSARMDRVQASSGGVHLVMPTGHRLDQHGVTSNPEFQAVVRQLVNTVNNMNAEWRLVIRDVHNTKDKSEQLQNRIEGLVDDTGTLKASIDQLRDKTARLTEKQNENGLLLDSLKNNVIETGAQTVADVPSFAYDEEIQDEIYELRGKLHTLSQRLDAIEFNRVVSSTSPTSTQQPVAEISLKAVEGSIVEEEQQYPKDCQDVYQRKFHTSGVYEIQPDGSLQPEKVYCEMENGGGWTVFQRREDGQIQFNRVWMEYQYGFGSLYGDFWLGNEILHKITNQKKYELRIDMWDWEGVRKYEHYGYFHVGSQGNKYRLRVKSHSGTAGDSFSSHDGMAFSTSDNDNDLHPGNCAAENKAGWWFAACYNSNLNGIYHTGWYNHKAESFADGIVWFSFKESDFYSLRRVEMKVRPNDS